VVSGKKDKHAADFYIYNQIKPDSVQDYSLVSVVKTVHTWRKPLLAITLAVAILTVIVSLFLPNYYKSTTVFYAASQDLFKPQKVFGYSQAEMYYYGGSEDIQRAITASTSFPVVDHLISEFNLYEHYGIKATSPKATFKVRERLMEHYQVVRTKYDALELSVEDRDPEIAARMANSARQKLNNVLSGIIKSSQRDLISSYGSALGTKEESLSAVEDSLRKFQRLFGIYDTEAQAEYLSTLITTVETRLVRERGVLDSYLKLKSKREAVIDTIQSLTAMIAGLEMQRDLLTGKDTTGKNTYNLDRFSEGKGRVEQYTDAYKKAINMLNIDKEMLKQMEAAVALDATALHLVEEGPVPIKKAHPRRTIIVIAATVIAFLLTVLCILLLESFKGEDWSFLKW
jgi:capsule polysaccharide export protein KpsE/RkpR